jgi:hypothetical protein
VKQFSQRAQRLRSGRNAFRRHTSEGRYPDCWVHHIYKSDPTHFFLYLFMYFC